MRRMASDRGEGGMVVGADAARRGERRTATRWGSSRRIATAKSGSLKRASQAAAQGEEAEARRREAEDSAVGEVVDALEDAKLQLRGQLGQPVRGRSVVVGACAGRARHAEDIFFFRQGGAWPSVA